VRVDAESVVVQFEDSGPGIESPDKLFQPFQPGAEGTGLACFSLGRWCEATGVIYGSPPAGVARASL
jgi:hypothetical protein